MARKNKTKRLAAEAGAPASEDADSNAKRDTETMAEPNEGGPTQFPTGDSTTEETTPRWGRRSRRNLSILVVFGLVAASLDTQVFNFTAPTAFMSTASTVTVTSNATITSSDEPAASQSETSYVPDDPTPLIPPWWRSDNVMSMEEAKASRVIPPLPLRKDAAVVDGVETANATSTDLLISQGIIPNAYPGPFDVDGTIIVDSSGELGNVMNHIAHARGVQLWAYETYKMRTRIVMKPQILRNGRVNSGKTKWNQIFLHRCFPQTRQWSFYEGLSGQLNDMYNFQFSGDLNGVADQTILSGINSVESTETAAAALKHFHELSSNRPWRQKVVMEGDNTVKSQNYTNATVIQQVLSAHPYPPPIFHHKSMSLGKMMGRYYRQLRQLLAFDVNAAEPRAPKANPCCRRLPEPDEYVLHFRNFQTELRNAAGHGFEDLAPRRIAHELFAHLKAGDKIAITTRQYGDNNNNTALNSLLYELRARDLEVRVIGDQDAVQDFCFLMHAQKEILGYARSTYFIWASILSNATSIRAYLVNTTANWRSGSMTRLMDYELNWGVNADPLLRDRYHLEVY